MGLVRMADFYGQPGSTSNHLRSAVLTFEFFKVYVWPELEQTANASKPIILADIGSANGLNFRFIHDRILDLLAENSTPKEAATNNTDPNLCRFYISDLNDHTKEVAKNYQDSHSVEFKQGSMYEKIFKSDSLDVIFASICMHWCRDEVFCTSGMNSQPYKAEFLQKSADDYLENIDYRYKELRKGGHLILASVFAEPGMRKIIEPLIEETAASEGLDLLLTFHIRTTDEIRAPFKNTMKWEIVFEQKMVITCPYYATFLDDISSLGFNSARIKFAEDAVKSLKSWSEFRVVEACRKKYGQENVTDFVAKFYEKLERHFYEKLAESRIDVPIHYLIAKKV